MTNGVHPSAASPSSETFAGIVARGGPIIPLDRLLPTVKTVARECRDRGERPERMIVMVKEAMFRTQAEFQRSRPHTLISEADWYRAIGVAVEEFYGHAD